MAKVKEFTWCTQIQNNGGAVSVSNNIRVAQFGNGFRQIASSGRNTNRREFNIVYGGKDYLDVLDFIQEHTLKKFLWVPPDGRIGLFVVLPDSINAKPVSNGLQEITARFSEEFTSAR